MLCGVAHPYIVSFYLQVSSTAGGRTNPSSPERRGFATPAAVRPQLEAPAGPGNGDRALRESLAAAEARLKAAEADSASKHHLQEKVQRKLILYIQFSFRSAGIAPSLACFAALK